MSAVTGTTGLQARVLLSLSRRMVEWSLVGAVVTGLTAVDVVVTGKKSREVDGMAEAAAVKNSLAGLRTAFVLHYLAKQVSATGANDPSRSAVQRNPFDLLEAYPSNYAGVMRESQAAQLQPGKWIFDPVCVCVGYLPLLPEWLSSASGDRMAWFAVSAPPEPFMLTKRESYLWQGSPLD